MTEFQDHDPAAGFTRRWVDSEIGAGAGAVAGALGQLAVLWVGAVIRDAPIRDLELGYLSLASLPVAGIGLFIGSAAGMLAHPIRSMAVGAVLSGVPGCCCWSFFHPSDSIFDILPTWICMMVAGGLSGWIGGFVGQRHLRRKNEPLEPALAAREQAEQRQAEKEAAALEIEQAAKKVEQAARKMDRCLACGHAMETHAACPKCGWTYL